MVSNDSWTLEFNEASRLADEINNMISGKSSLPQAGPEAQRHLSATRRKVTILRTKLETLQSLLSKLPTQQQISAKEMKRRQDSLANVTSKCNEMATSLNMSNFGIRDSLLGPDKKQDDLVNRTVGLDNHGIVGLQRQVMKEQDEGLEKLEETVLSTKHIALAVNEELNLHTTLLDNLDQDVDATNTRLQWAQKKLSLLNKRTKGGCCSIILVVIAMVALIFVIYGLVKFL